MPPAQQKVHCADEGHPETAPNLDEKGFGDALIELAEPLRRRAYRLTRDGSEADDLTQDTLTKAWSARLKFQPGTNLQAWTYTILRNLLLTQIRRSRRMVALEEHTVEGLAAIGAGQHQVAELGEALEAIESLSADHGAALHAVTVEGLDYKAAADKLNLSEAALKSRVHRARAALVRGFEEGFPKPLLKPARPKATVTMKPSRFRGVWSTAKASNDTLWIG